ncbi:MAG TPA: terminase large subunit, partial [Limnochordia bacterium]|nr:terminase large subunit [Limnochordia bacterium]
AFRTIADSAEPKSIDELRSFGMRIEGAKKGPGSVEFGIKWLQDLEQIVIDPTRCPRAAKEFVNYALEVDRNGEVKSRFPDRENHSLDACRYALFDDMDQSGPQIFV